MKRISLILPILLLLIACEDNDLAKVAKGLQLTASSIGTLQTTVIEANKLNLLTEDETRTILQICLETNKAGKDATAITRGLTELTTVSKSQIFSILVPVIKSITAGVERTTFIKDENTRIKIRTILLSVQSALTSIQIIVGGD